MDNQQEYNIINFDAHKAREKYNQSFTKELCNLLQKISNEAETGKIELFYYVPIKEEVKVALRGKGFSVEDLSDRDGCCCRISW